MKNVLRIQPYLGKENEVRRLGTVGEDVALRLVSSYEGSGCNIVTDNFFTSLKLARSLKQLNMTLLGTVRKNKKELPCELLANRGRSLCSSKFSFNSKGDTMIVSYTPKKNKNVLLLSSSRFHDTIDTSNAARKPALILQYNKLKGGVDTIDQMLRHYTTKIASRRWSFSTFCNTLDVAGVNTFVL